MTDMIKSTDINPKRVRDADHFNRVRKAWVLQISDADRSKLIAVPAISRFQLYKMFDDEITWLWIKAMKTHNDQATESGAKMVNIDGYHHFESQFILDTNELLIQVASNWINVNLKSILANEAH